MDDWYFQLVSEFKSKMINFKYIYLCFELKGPYHGNQNFTQVDKSENGKVRIRELMGVMYVPLTDKHKQLRE